MAESLTFTTIGEMIKEKREIRGISLSEVSRLTGISKGVLSKIETGETKRPELRTLKPIAEILEIPYEEIIERYINVEHRIGIYHDFLVEVIEVSTPSLINKVATKFLENLRNETFTSLEYLYKLASTNLNGDVRVALYNTIVQYARTHGLPNYIAKGLFQKYLIERQDLKRMEESFKYGEEIVHYIDFLSHEEKVTFYYKMALQAFALKKYEACIELGKVGHAEDTTENEIKERVALAICNSYMFTENYHELESHLLLYEKLGYKFIHDRIKFFRAIILARTGNEKLAIPLLKECLEESTEKNRLHRVNELVEALLRVGDLDSLSYILEQENKNTIVKDFTPYKYSELGKYFRNKGVFLVSCNLFDEAMEAYLQGMNCYSKINDTNGIMGCSNKIYAHHCEQNKEMQLGLLNKLHDVYNMVNKG
ncbi:helix-turn-helix domain-containing protein [Brevibacillus laterosporus]|uniref:helix-turn-helix domain-containing protein n=1 Tax=Brevibacillus laterosporus TaxID=1465 RepID=UPI000CE2B6E5|nr:helix-turn-helix domain-containing protein [Brevibacillus laterosporus]MBG9800209.1 DNA-binding protein [Brevibacillus laterosporus]MCR8937875.1 helix-turn-helix domain-containing protein [Brevibacillus laterosporus]MCZ0840514.1 helix-turn-helix domain-containing protein [Brevibacillus laterosporus]MCZ0847432.1 helix-turn-helix domain-containing protein [Brevibacillus laterosporus]MED1911256.1 helix-turn-helix domain-containing protein [Brevibacillus laterosporus]